MQRVRLHARSSAAIALAMCFIAGSADAGGIRVVTYNINADTGTSTPQPGLDTVLQAIGNANLAGNTQPIDVLALQELYFTPSTTLQPLVASLNAIYGNGAYTFDQFVGATTGNLTGNGPNGLVYKTSTIQVLSAVGIGTVSGSGAPRQPVRYKLHPIGYPSSADFYIYVSHYKASSGSSNATRRNIEATTIRADADALGPNVHIIYAGDFNLTGGSTEAAYQTLIAAGNGQAKDPVNPAGNWSNTAPFVNLCTESATTLNARFDFLMVSGATLNQSGFQLVPGSYTVFGNNGSTAFGGNVSAASNTALPELANRTQVLSLLTTVTDHLPVVADFTIAGLGVSPPTNLIASSNPVCSGSPTTLSASVPSGQTVDWFTGSCGGTLVGSGASLPVLPAAATTYFARARDLTSGAVSATCASVTVGVSQPPTIGQQPASQSICSTTTGSFSIATSGGTGPFTYDWQIQNGASWVSLDINPVALSCGGSAVATSPNLNQTTIAITPCPGVIGYQVRCVMSNACGSVASDAATLSVCYANCDCSAGTPALTANDFSCFLSKFRAGDVYANCDGSTGSPSLTAVDFSCFLSAFRAGCP